jgi:hypothetical protein
MRLARHPRPLIAALVASCALHGVALMTSAGKAPARPRYVVLETRLQMPGPAAEGRLFAASRAPLTATVVAAGGANVQSPTPSADHVPIARSDLTLPHDFRIARRFEDGVPMGPREAALIVAPTLPDLSRYYRANELDVVAAPRGAIPLDVEALRFAAGLATQLRFRIFIDATGAVDDVLVESDGLPPAVIEQVRAAFLEAPFTPARRDGYSVKSQKLVELVHQDDADEDDDAPT